MAATVTDLEAEIQVLKQAQTDLGTRVTNDLAALKAQVAAGATPEDLTAQITELETVVAGLNATDPAATS